MKIRVWGSNYEIRFEKRDRARLIGKWVSLCPVTRRREIQDDWLTADYEVIECEGCGQTLTLDEVPF